MINGQELPFLKTACDEIDYHSSVQQQALSEIFAYLSELNALHGALNLEKEKDAAENHEYNSSEAITKIHEILLAWVPDGPLWSCQAELPEVVAHACPSGGQIARGVWSFFHCLTWRHPDLPPQQNDFGVTWYELAVHFTLYAGTCLPVWVKHKDQHHAWPYPFDSTEVKILKPEVRSLWHQAHNLRAVVKYLESSTGQYLYPRFKKTGASTMIRLGYHRSLTGGIASRPRLPQADLALQVLSQYSSMAGQPYPLNVRVPFQPKLDSAILTDLGPPDMSFSKRHNLYQRVRKCLRNKTCLSSLLIEP